MNTDSHAALRRLALHFAKQARENGPYFIHGRCQMHMFFASLVAMLSPLALVNPLYCSTILLHRGQNMRHLRAQVRQYVQERLRVVYVRPPAEHMTYNRAIVRLLDLLDRDDYHLDRWRL